MQIRATGKLEKNSGATATELAALLAAGSGRLTIALPDAASHAGSNSGDGSMHMAAAMQLLLPGVWTPLPCLLSIAEDPRFDKEDTRRQKPVGCDHVTQLTPDLYSGWVHLGASFTRDILADLRTYNPNVERCPNGPSGAEASTVQATQSYISPCQSSPRGVSPSRQLRLTAKQVSHTRSSPGHTGCLCPSHRMLMPITQDAYARHTGCLCPSHRMLS